MFARIVQFVCTCLPGVFLASCGTVYHITKVTPATTKTPVRNEGKEKQLGVLYYAKVGVCRHETKYEETIFSFVVTDNKATDDAKKVVLQKSFGYAEYLKIRDWMDASSDDEQLVKTLSDAPAYRPFDLAQGEPQGNLMLISNRNLLETAVDYQHEYYFNAKRPLSGSATASIKIGPDGSMSEASATVQSDTLKTILSALPTQSLTPAALSALMKAPGKPPKYSIAVTQHSYVWAFSDSPNAVSASGDQCPAPAGPLQMKGADGKLNKYNVTREVPPAEVKPAAAAASAAAK